MVAADQLLAHDRAQRERIAAVRALVGEGDDAARLAAKERDVLAEYLAATAASRSTSALSAATYH